MSLLPIAGIVPFTSTDYPDHFSLVVFCQGCPWKCRYCHNTHLQPFSSPAPSSWTWRRVLALLNKRKGLLDAIVFSGGEPTVHSGLLNAMREAKKSGFKVGLHTGGQYPEKLKMILPEIDWVGIDIKAPFEMYETVTKIPGSGEKTKESLELILQSGVSYECRTTVHPALLTADDLDAMSRTLSEMGVTHYVLQEFRADGCKDKELSSPSYLSIIDPELEAKLAPQFQTFLVR